MERINEYTNSRYKEAIEKKIIKTELNYHVAHGNFISVLRPRYNNYLHENEIRRSILFKESVANRFPWLYRTIKTVKKDE